MLVLLLNIWLYDHSDNYDATATVDDGSCTYTISTIAGHSDN